MDLLLLAQDVTWGGRTGDAIHLRELARGLAHRGHSVRVLARAGGESVTVRGVEVRLLASRLNMGIAAFRTPLFAQALVREVSHRRPDLVYSRGFGDLAEARAIHALGLPMVFEVNGDAIAERQSQTGRPMPIRSARIRKARAGFRSAQRIVTVTERLRRRLIEEYGVPADKVVVVPNAADTERFTPLPKAEARAAIGLPTADPVVGFVGNLAPWQGVDFLIRAVSEVLDKHLNVRLLIVGDGQAGPELRELSKQVIAGTRTRFVGAVPYERVPLHIAAMDVGTAPMTRERLVSGSSAIKVLEYLACARPVVASRIPGLEFLETNDCGILVPPEDASALAAGLDRALEDESWRRSSGDRGRAFVERGAGWAPVAAAVEDVCRAAVAM